MSYEFAKVIKELGMSPDTEKILVNGCLKGEFGHENKIKHHRLIVRLLFFVCAVCLLSSIVMSADNIAANADSTPAKPTLEEIRISMDKWIETQKIISKERKDWQQGKDILVSRLELVKKEVVAVEEKTKQAESSVAETNKKRNEIVAENDQLKAAGAQLTETITGIENKIRQISKQLPEPIQTKLQPLFQRIPEDPNKTRVSVAERFQNVLGILNELNKANNEISVNYEVHNIAGGKPSEVKVIYVGLAQAYYVSARGDAGIGCPTADGWKWEPSKNSARDILTALEIFQGKQTPAFVPLPVKIQ